MDTIATRSTDKKGSKVAKSDTSQGKLLSAAPTKATSPLKLSTEITEILITALAQHVGPVSTHLTQRVAVQSESLPEMINKLSRYVPDGPERHDFIEQTRTKCLKSITGKNQKLDSRKASNIPILGRPNAKYKSTVGTVISEEKIQRLIQLLSTYVGPLASHIVRSCIEESHTEIKLCTAIANYITDEKERKLDVVN
ncbi:hypothetical protein [Hahella ganghwensis]|uniref:hypothetical protein n=1 Tax=Hahella ganghwensis TaxID=286420 RepID=UPI000375FCA1|nr:hypothetical protein [Hahella ganghwensis]